MNSHILCGAMVLAAASLMAAESAPKDDVASAVKTLGDKANYSWRTTIVVPEDSPFHPGPTDGKTEKGGFTYVKMSFGDNNPEFVVKGETTVVNPEGSWEPLSELDNAEGPARFLGLIVRNFKAPVAQAGDIAATTKELKRDGDVYSSDLTEEGAKALLTFRRGGGGNVSNAKGSAKFWVKDGLLSKYEFKVTGSVDFNGNSFDVDRATTVEIKDVGTTKIDVPDDAKKKLEPAKAEPSKTEPAKQ
jgi:hypothetical protein